MVPKIGWMRVMGKERARREKEKKVMLRMGEMTEAAQEAEEAGAGRVGFKEEDEAETQQSLEATSTPPIPKGIHGAGESK